MFIVLLAKTIIPPGFAAGLWASESGEVRRFGGPVACHEFAARFRTESPRLSPFLTVKTISLSASHRSGDASPHRRGRAPVWFGSPPSAGVTQQSQLSAESPRQPAKSRYLPSG